MTHAFVFCYSAPPPFPPFPPHRILTVDQRKGLREGSGQPGIIFLRGFSLYNNIYLVRDFYYPAGFYHTKNNPAALKIPPWDNIRMFDFRGNFCHAEVDLSSSRFGAVRFPEASAFVIQRNSKGTIREIPHQRDKSFL